MYFSRRQMYKIRSSRKTDSQYEKRSSGSPILLKILSENQFSGKTYFYTIASRVHDAPRLRRQDLLRLSQHEEAGQDARGHRGLEHYQGGHVLNIDRSGGQLLTNIWGSRSPWVTNCLLWGSSIVVLRISCTTNKKLHNSRIPSTSDDNTHARWWSETGQILGLRFAPCLLFRYWLCWWVCVLN